MFNQNVNVMEQVKRISSKYWRQEVLRLTLSVLFVLFSSVVMMGQGAGTYYRSSPENPIASKPAGYTTDRGSASDYGIKEAGAYGLYCDLFYEYETGKLAWIGFNPYLPWVFWRNFPYDGGHTVSMDGAKFGSSYETVVYPNSSACFTYLVKGLYVKNDQAWDNHGAGHAYDNISDWLSSEGYTTENIVGSVYYGNGENSEYSSQATMVLDQFGDGTDRLGKTKPGQLEYADNWVLPDCIEKIAPYAFKTSYLQTNSTSDGNHYYLKLYSINLDNIKTIGDHAFQNCALLRCASKSEIIKGTTVRPTTFDLSSVTSIGDNAFQYCGSIPGVIIHHNVDPNGESNQFYLCTSMTSAEFTGDATRIPAYFFNGCTALKTVKMDGITELKAGCFNNCTSLHFDMLELAGKTIGSKPFSGVSADWMHVDNTTQIAADNSILTGMVNTNVYIDVNSVQDYTKYVKDGLNSTVNIYVPCDLLDAYKAAEGWSNYATQIKSIPGCGGTGYYVLLDGVEYYNGVEYDHVGPYTLRLKSIGNARTESATTLGIPQSFEIGGETLTVVSVGNNVCSSIPFTTVQLPYTLTSIGDECFANSTNMTTINLNNVETLGGSAFYGCSALTAASLNSLTEITGQSAFRNCTSLGTVTLGSGLTEIPDNTFNGCTAMQTINLANIEVVGTSAFYQCSSLLTANLSAVSSIGESAFMNCSSLTTVSPLNSTLKTVPAYAFKNCTSLSTIDVTNLMWMGQQAFCNTGLIEVTLHQSLYYFEQAFMDCLHLTNVTVNGPGIDVGAFKGCTALEEVEIDRTISVLNEAFYGCSALKTIDFTKIDRFGDYCFAGCTSLEVSLDITDGIIYFGKEPFSGVTFSMLQSDKKTLYDYDSENDNFNTGLIDNAILSGVVNSTIRFMGKDDLYDIDEYLKKDENTGKYTIDENTYIWVHRDIWQTYQDDTDHWADVKTHIKTWPPYDFYVIRNNDHENLYLDVEYDLNNDGENTLTLTYVDPDPDDNVDFTKLEIPQTMYLQNKQTYEWTTFTVTRIADNRLDTSDKGVLEGFGFTQVVLPTTITEIPKQAFKNCSNLKTINLGHVTKVGNEAFWSCSSLEEPDLRNVKVYGTDAFKYCYKLNLHLDLRNVTSIGAGAFDRAKLKSAWVGKVTGERMFYSTEPMNIYIAEEDPNEVNAEHVTEGLDDASVVYVICRNITTSENLTNPSPTNTNPLQLFHDNASWGDPEVWKYVYPMLHQETAGEREKTYTTFCFDKPIDFRGTDENGNNIGEEYSSQGYLYWMSINSEGDEYELYRPLLKENDNLAIRGMLQFYKETDNNSSGFKNNRIQALTVTGFNYTPGNDVVPESGQIFTEPAGVRPAMTGVLIKWHPGEEYHGATGMSDYYPLPPVRWYDEYSGHNSSRMTEEDFQAAQDNTYSDSYYDEETEEWISKDYRCIIRKGTFDNSANEVNTGGRNLERWVEGDEEGQYKDNYPHIFKYGDDGYIARGGTTTLVNGVYQGRDYDNLMIGNTIRIDSVIYNPWYWAYATDGNNNIQYNQETGKPMLNKPNIDFDRNYKQMGLNVSCYFRRFYNENEMNYTGRIGSYMRAYRAFLRLPLTVEGESTNSEPSQAHMVNALFTIGDAPEDETTEIKNVNVNDNHKVIDSSAFYDLQGRLVNMRRSTPNAQRQLPKGVYINNGKKVVIK